MKHALIVFSIFLPQFQDDKKIEEKIVVRIPTFYEATGRRFDVPTEIGLKSAPEGVRRKYIVQNIDEFGDPAGRPEELTEESFYNLAWRILQYGVLDGLNPRHFNLNYAYVKFVQLLARHKILTRDLAVPIAKRYYESKWIESAYFFDEAFPGIFLPKQWKELGRDGAPFGSPYLTRVLAAIKIGDDLSEILAWLDKNTPSEGLFYNSAKAYAELVRKGALIPKDIQIKLLKAYLEYHKVILNANLPKIYLALGLPLPSKEVTKPILCETVQKSEEPNLEIVEAFRFFGVDFPKEHAASYRDAYLKYRGSLENIDYLSRVAGEEAKPELWIRYGDSMFFDHFSKERRKDDQDTEDYYHLAAEAYSRAAKGGVLVPQRRIDALLKEEADLSVRVRDLIAVYELGGYDPKMKWLVEKFDKRIEKINNLAAGIFYKDNGEINWWLDEYGRKILPFRDEMELAAYLREPERYRKLCARITERVANKLFHEAWTFLKLYQDCPLVLYAMMHRSDTPAYIELNALMDLLESLSCKDGLWCLAQYLHESGFDLPARRAFQLSGYGKCAEDQYYGKKDEGYWIRKQARFNFAVRRQAILNWQKEKK